MLFGSKKERFTLTEDHLKLFQRMYVKWDPEMYDGAPAIDIKRPYGNSYPAMDIVEILEWEYDTENYGLSKELEEKALKLHREMGTAMQIALCTLSFEPGVYEKENRYSDRSWYRVDE